MSLLQTRPLTDNAATFKRWVTDVAKGDLSHAPYADDAVAYDPIGTYKGKPQIVESFKTWNTAFPEATAEVTNQITEGDQVASEVIFRGTHRGILASPMGPIAPTGKSVELRVAVVDKFRNGLIQREHAYFDLAGLMQQLGLAQPKV